MIKLNKSRTASFDVDAEKCFTPLCPDELPVPGGDEIVGELNKQAQFANVRVGCKDAHSPQAVWVADEEHPQFEPVEGRDVDIRWNLHGVPGTKGFELLDGLPHPADYNFFVWKGVEPDMHPYGGCYHDLNNRLSTGVIEYLRATQISTVIVGGLALDYCVKETALQLLSAGFNVVLNLGACRAISQDTAAEAVKEIAGRGGIIIQDASMLSLEQEQEFPCGL